jgi:hypothetical protein
MITLPRKSEIERLNFDSVLIVTYGRSGSTLLQGLLNSIDGCLVRGENYGFLFGMYTSYKNLLRAKTEREGKSPQQPWFGSQLLDDRLFLKQTRKLVQDLLLANVKSPEKIRCYGFKEIRYQEDTVLEYLDFLRKIFQKPAFIFNTRNIDDVAKSAWWKDREPEEVRLRLTSLENRFKEYSQDHDNGFHIQYEDVVNKTKNLKSLYKFLGARYEPKTVDEILSLQHSYQPKKRRHLFCFPSIG